LIGQVTARNLQGFRSFHRCLWRCKHSGTLLGADWYRVTVVAREWTATETSV